MDDVSEFTGAVAGGRTQGDEIGAPIPHPPSLSNFDREFVELACALGKRGWGRVHPNPMVGCVLVLDETIVGQGWHTEYGGPHAEVMALRQAGERARGATAYVSLEPCRHEGKTPPCTGALVEAGVSRVVFGAEDPGTRSGGGAGVLREAGVDVLGPLLDTGEARRLNPAFFHQREDRPFVALKFALSLDARIAARRGIRTRISGSAAEKEVHRLRAGFDAILVGTRTVQVDDPLLTVRGDWLPRTPPIRIILDARGVVDPNGRLFKEGDAPVWVVTGRQPEERWAARVRDRGADIVSVSVGEDGRIELGPALHELWDMGVRSLLCEGGGVLGSALLSEDLVDRLILIVAPDLVGVAGVPAFPDIPAAGASGSTSPSLPGWSFVEPPRLVGRDLWCELEREA